jgi:hypothetical protein
VLRLLVTRLHGLYIDYAVRHCDVIFWAYDYFDYSSQLVNLSRTALRHQQLVGSTSD